MKVEKRKIVSIIYIIIILSLIISQLLVMKHDNSLQNTLRPALVSPTLQSVILYNTFQFSTANEGIKLDGLQTITSENDSMASSFNTNKSIFVIYVPLSEIT